jgi:3-oxoacyl-[acyl-carrier protein] reductase
MAQQATAQLEQPLEQPLEQQREQQLKQARNGQAPQALAGKRAFVSGGSRGIGAAVVRRLAAQGARVAFTYLNRADAAQALVAEVEASGGQARAYRADSGDARPLSEAIDNAAEALGGLDIVVANAAVLAIAPLDQLALEDFDRTLQVNVRGVFVTAQAGARHLQAGGRIIVIGSTNAERVPFPGMAAYAMSKTALVGLVRAMARDLGPRGITVNNVQPGPVDTDMNPDSGDFAAQVRALTALERYAKPEEIAAFVAWLSGSEAAYLTGASLNIDGGFAA